MKAIFLDIDGVLNVENWMLKNKPWIDEHKLFLIGILCKITGSSVILSTNWREIWDEELYTSNPNNGICKAHKLFDKYNIKVVGKIPVFGKREDEIFQYINENKIEKYIIIDDMNLNVNNFLHINSEKGFIFLDFIKSFIILHT